MNPDNNSPPNLSGQAKDSPQTISDQTKADIREMVKPFADSKHLDFSTIQILVIAVALEDGKASLPRIMARACREFYSLQVMAAETLLNDSYISYGCIYQGHYQPEVRKESSSRFDWNRALICYDNPLKWCNDTGEWSISEMATRSFLGLHTRHKGPFPFLKLPPEIRQRVYNKLFCFQPDVLVYELESGWFGPYGARICPKASDYGPEYVDFDGWHPRSTERPILPEMRHLLAFLTVNKQIYNEAVSTLYAKNVWYLCNIPDLYDFLRNIAPSRAKHLTRLTLNYRSNFFSQRQFRIEAGHSMKTLSELPSIKTIHLRIFEGSTFPALGLERTEQALLLLPGFTSLTQIRGLKKMVVQSATPEDCEISARLLPPLLTSSPDEAGPDQDDILRAVAELFSPECWT